MSRLNISHTLSLQISVTVHCHPGHVDCLAEYDEVSLVYRLCMHGYVINDVNINVLCNPPPLQSIKPHVCVLSD